MAEDSVDLLVTPEVTKSSGIELRRHSTGKVSSGNSEEKVLSRYLRASTGSYHDFCKYGRKHAFEANESRSILKRVARKPLYQGSEESVGETKILVAALGASTDSKLTRKTSAAKLKDSVDSKPQVCETLGTHNHKHEMLTKSLESSKPVDSEVSGNRKKTASVKVKTSNHLKSHTIDLSKTTRQETSSASKVKASSKSTASKDKEMKLSSKPNCVTGKTMSSKNPSEGSSGQRNSELKVEKRTATSKEGARKLMTPSRASLPLKPTLHRVASINARKQKSLKIVSHLRNQPENRENKPKEDVEVEEKTLYVIKMNRENNTLASDQNACPDVESSFKMNGENNTLESDQNACPDVELSLKMNGENNTLESDQNACPDVELSLKMNRENNTLESDQNACPDIELSLKMNGENNTLESDQNACPDVELSLPQLLSSPKFSSSSSSQSSSEDDQEESEYTTSEVEEDSFSVNNETEHLESGEDLEAEQKGKPPKNGVEEKDCPQMTKGRFIRGKWVEIKSENSSPRRLKFRRGKVGGEIANVKSEGQRKSYKRRDGDVGERNDATTSPEKVVLRHQDVQGKKDEQGLFNNVIEETASKLAETRKSKVKALVGAFETVISLQEKKPSASNVV